jgi:hypothetical protein
VQQDSGFFESIALAADRNKRSSPGLFYSSIGDQVQKSSYKMRELMTALVVAFGLAVVAFGAAVLASTYVAN